MKNAKKTNAVETKIESNAKKLTIADVARELDVAPKRLRAMLRKSPKIYAPFRKTRFDKNSVEHKNAIAAVKSLLKPAA